MASGSNVHHHSTPTLLGSVIESKQVVLSECLPSGETLTYFYLTTSSSNRGWIKFEASHIAKLIADQGYETLKPGDVVSAFKSSLGESRVKSIVSKMGSKKSSVTCILVKRCDDRAAQSPQPPISVDEVHNLLAAVDVGRELVKVTERQHVDLSGPSSSIPDVVCAPPKRMKHEPKPKPDSLPTMPPSHPQLMHTLTAPRALPPFQFSDLMSIKAMDQPFLLKDDDLEQYLDEAVDVYEQLVENQIPGFGVQVSYEPSDRGVSRRVFYRFFVVWMAVVVLGMTAIPYPHNTFLVEEDIHVSNALDALEA
jgi:hypothetical protein